MNKPVAAHVRFNTNKIINVLGTVGPVEGVYTLKLIDKAIRIDNLSVSFKTAEDKSIIIVKTNDGSCDITSAYREGHTEVDAILYAIKKKGYILTEDSHYIRKMTDAEVTEFNATTTEEAKDVTTKDEVIEPVVETTTPDVDKSENVATIENVNQVNTSKKGGSHKK